LNNTLLAYFLSLRRVRENYSLLHVQLIHDVPEAGCEEKSQVVRW
jgi:hypothetical protein